MNDPTTATVRRMLSPNSRSVPRDVVLLFTWLKKDPAFRKRFLERASYFYKEVFSPTRTQTGIDHFAKMYDPEVPQERMRWNHVRTWEKSLRVIRRFFERRPAIIRRQFRSYFDLTEEETDQLFPVWEKEG